MIKYILFMILLSTNCKAEKGEFDKYVELFKTNHYLYRGKHIKKLPPIRFGSLPNKYAGVCLRIPNNPQIVIDASFWSIYDDLEKEQLILHELAHCALGIDHIWGKHHIMNPAGVHKDIYKAQRWKLIKDLFND